MVVKRIWKPSSAIGKEYHYSRNGETYSNSVAYCERLGGRLAVIKSLKEWEYLKRFGETNYNQSIWVGALFDHELKGFKWNQKTSAELNDNEPNCMGVAIRNDALVTEHCSSKIAGALCERPLNSVPKTTGRRGRNQQEPLADNPTQPANECDAMATIKDIMKQFDGGFAKQVARQARLRAKREFGGKYGGPGDRRKARQQRSHC